MTGRIVHTPDEERRVWDGHHRIVAAIDLGLTVVPVADARYSDTGRPVQETTGA